MGDTASAKPAFFRILQNGWLSFYGISDKGVTHTDFDTAAAPITNLLIEINMIESHRIPP
jgi:hypothetical protein